MSPETHKEKLRNLEYLHEHPVLIIGGTGTIGRGLMSSLKAELGEGSVVSVNRTGRDGVALDITEPKSLAKEIKNISPSIIYHLAAATNVNKCESDQDWAWRVNVDGTKNLLDAARDIPVVYFSTDFVFSGDSEICHKEGDHPQPLSVYGQTKFVAETIFLDSKNPGFIARISFPWYKIKDHLADPYLNDTPFWIAKTLLKGEPVSAFENVTGNWTSANYLNDNLFHITTQMLHDHQKIIHLAGKHKTALEVARAIEKYLSLNTNIRLGEVVPTHFSPVEGKVANRPQKGGLDTSFAKSKSIIFPDLLTEIEAGRWMTKEDLDRLILSL